MANKEAIRAMKRSQKNRMRMKAVKKQASINKANNSIKSLKKEVWNYRSSSIKEFDAQLDNLKKLSIITTFTKAFIEGIIKPRLEYSYITEDIKTRTDDNLKIIDSIMNHFNSISKELIDAKNMFSNPVGNGMKHVLSSHADYLQKSSDIVTVMTNMTTYITDFENAVKAIYNVILDANKLYNEYTGEDKDSVYFINTSEYEDFKSFVKNIGITLDDSLINIQTNNNTYTTDTHVEDNDSK